MWLWISWLVAFDGNWILMLEIHVYNGDFIWCDSIYLIYTTIVLVIQTTVPWFHWFWGIKTNCIGFFFFLTNHISQWSTVDGLY